MVEMRWVAKYESEDKDGTWRGAKAVAYKVLQYRYFISGFVPAGKWSEWIDVPTVTEEKNNAG